MKITTKSGFKCTIDENRVRDWRFITLTARMAKSRDEIEIINDANAIMTFLLGEDGAEKLIKHLSKSGGIADVEKVIVECGEIINILKDQVKKSQSSSV